MKWVFFSYSLPTKPSKSRVYIWRQLKKLGAVKFQSFWILPASSERTNELRKLMEEIERFKGESIMIHGKTVDKAQAEQINRAFMDSRNEEYHELIKKCEDFFHEIQGEIERENFIFAEVEENEEELTKLKLWMKKIEKRDFLGAPLKKTANEKMRSCERVFEDFAQRVYDRQDDVS